MSESTSDDGGFLPSLWAHIETLAIDAWGLVTGVDWIDVIVATALGTTLSYLIDKKRRMRDP